MNNSSRQRAIRIYHSDISLYYIDMREYTLGKAICQNILANIIITLVKLTHLQKIYQYHDSFHHGIGKYFCEGVFHKVTGVLFPRASEYAHNHLGVLIKQVQLSNMHT